MIIIELLKILFGYVLVTLLGLEVENLALILLVDLAELVLETDHAEGELLVNLVKVYHMLDVLLVKVLYLREQIG
jgi:hypothetical protein